MANNPFAGAGYLIRGVGLLTRPGLRRFVLMPLLVNVLLFAGGIWLGYEQFQGLLGWMDGQIPQWLQWLRWVVWPLFFIALVMVVFYTFALVANLIAAPFNGLLAEKVELHLTGQPIDGGGGVKKMLVELVPTLIDEIRKLLYGVVWAIPLLVLFLIPGVNIAAPFLWLAFSAWVMAVEYGDYPMGNHNLRFREMRARLRQRRLLSLGFGAAVLAMTMIPVVNFIAMPSAVAGATALWVREMTGAEA